MNAPRTVWDAPRRTWAMPSARSGLLRTEPKVSALREPAAIASPSTLETLIMLAVAMFIGALVVAL